MVSGVSLILSVDLNVGTNPPIKVAVGKGGGGVFLTGVLVGTSAMVGTGVSVGRGGGWVKVGIGGTAVCEGGTGVAEGRKTVEVGDTGGTVAGTPVVGTAVGGMAVGGTEVEVITGGIGVGE